MKALILYWSATGNTEKVANAIRVGMENVGLDPKVRKIEDAKSEELLDYDIVCLGSPSHMFLPAEPVLQFVRGKMRDYSKRGFIKPCAPKVQNKYAVVFCTYSGPHTGIDEAAPAGKFMQQFLAHLGFEVIAEWYVIGEFHGNEILSTQGKLGNIKGRPNRQDLTRITDATAELVKILKPKK